MASSERDASCHPSANRLHVSISGVEESLSIPGFPGAYPNTSLASLSDRHITKGHENDFKLVCYLYVTCILQWGNKTEKVMPTLLGIKKKKKSRVSKTYFNVMQFIFVNYFFI